MNASPPISVTIVTPTFNSEATLERTIRSVWDQQYPHLQHVVVDGGSTDGTLEILRRYERRYPIQWQSEPDGGIADAFNKGVQRATGELVAILNSDDWYADGAIDRMVAAHQTRLATNQSPAILHGDSVWHWPESIPNCPVPRRIRPRLWGGRDQVGRAFWFDMPVNHPTCFVPSSIYQRVGLFDTAYRVAMDFDWMLRAFLAGARFAYVPEVITHFQTGGVSGQHTRLAIREVCRAQQRSRVYPFRRRLAYWGKMSVNRLKSLTGVRLLPGSVT